MAHIKLIDKDSNEPGSAICPTCKREMQFDLGMFKDNITKVVQSNCPFCKQTLFTCILVMTNVNMDRLMDQLKRVIVASEGPTSKILQ